MTYFIGLPDKPPSKSFEDLNEAISTCKGWRRVYAQSDYRVTNTSGEVLFPKYILKTEYGSFGAFLTRHEDYGSE